MIGRLSCPCFAAWLCLAGGAPDAWGGDPPIDREAWVGRHNPGLTEIDPESPFTVGNGEFAFTADVTGLQSFGDLYYARGVPLETKARWAWHTRSSEESFTLEDANVAYEAYGRTVSFPTRQDSPAGQWLRQNPHDLPLARIGLLLEGRPLQPSQVSDIRQELDLWRGRLASGYRLDGEAVSVVTVVHGKRDVVAARIASGLLRSGRLGISLKFPRGYDPDVKNTPDIDWSDDAQHDTRLIDTRPNNAVFSRRVDDETHFVRLSWNGEATLERLGAHSWRLMPGTSDADENATETKAFEFAVGFFENRADEPLAASFEDVRLSAEAAWEKYWLTGGAMDFAGSTDARAGTLERRIVLSQYLLGVQARSEIPAQETGLTSSSWYGKHHTEMAWWHTAHWILWGRDENAERVLAWYLGTMESAEQTAQSRGLRGARWSKMVGPEGRESPGGNPLIIWNQPQVIHLAEMLYQAGPGPDKQERYGRLVEKTAEGMSSMLVWEADKNRYSLTPPIWIAQEIYDPLVVFNPGFELSYWRYGLQIAQRWRMRSGRKENTGWAKQLAWLAALPTSGGLYVAIESVPDTFVNRESRQDHPTMLAAYGLLDDHTVDVETMARTLDAVLETWDWNRKIWGWDYPMIAMTAARLGNYELALDVLLTDGPNNRYLPNGHCPQQGAGLPVYLPANGAFLAAMAMLAPYLESGGRQGEWKVRTDGLRPLD